MQTNECEWGAPGDSQEMPPSGPLAMAAVIFAIVAAVGHFKFDGRPGIELTVWRTHAVLSVYTYVAEVQTAARGVDCSCYCLRGAHGLVAVEQDVENEREAHPGVGPAVSHALVVRSELRRGVDGSFHVLVLCHIPPQMSKEGSHPIANVSE